MAMDHEDAELLIADFAAGQLAATSSEAFRQHLASCARCQEALAFEQRLRRQVRGDPAAGSGPHPAADELVALAAIDPALPLARAAEIRAHLDYCPECTREVEFARRACAHDGPRPQGRWGARGLSTPAVAAAALAALLAYPAFLGMVLLPQARREITAAQGVASDLQQGLQRVQDDLAGARRELSTLAEWGGAASMLFLRAPLRGGEHRLPTVALRPGQPFLTVLVECSPPGAVHDRATTVVHLRLVSLPDARECWSCAATFGSLWSADAEVLSVMIPASIVAPGRYRLEVDATGGGGAAITPEFRVLPAGQ